MQWPRAPVNLSGASGLFPETNNGMNSSDNLDNQAGYNPADDDNQGVAQLMAQGAQANNNAGVAQENGVISTGLNPSPEPYLPGETSDDPIDGGSNNDMLIEEAIESGDVDVEGDDTDRDTDDFTVSSGRALNPDAEA